MDVKRLTIYMLRNNVTGMYYLRRCGTTPQWRTQEYASVWLSKNGPTGAKNKASGKRLYGPKLPAVDLEVVSFNMVEDNGR